MMRLMLIFSSLAISILFMFFSPTGQMGFPFSKVTMAAENWFYYLFEHIVTLLLSLAIVSGASQYKVALWTFVGIQVVDTLDYLLFYGEQWSDYIPSWNILKVSFFGLAILYEGLKDD